MGEKASAAKGCLGVFGSMAVVLLIGSCVFGGGSGGKTDAEAASETASDAGSVATTSTESNPNVASDDANVAEAEATVKEQFFPDQVDHSGSKSYQKEWWMVKGAVRQAGYPCAAVAYVEQQFDGTFKAVCKVALHTNKYDAFVINPDTQSVDPL